MDFRSVCAAALQHNAVYVAFNINEEGEKMYCKKCGAQIDSDSAFCQNCGEKQIDFNDQSDINIKTSRPKKTNKIAVVVLILFFLTCAIIVIAAITNGGITDSNGNKISSDSITGAWIDNADLFGTSYLVTIEFSSNGNYIMYNNLLTNASNITRQGTYTRSGNTITMNYGYDSVATYTYNPSSDTISDSSGNVYRRR